LLVAVSLLLLNGDGRRSGATDASRATHAAQSIDAGRPPDPSGTAQSNRVELCGYGPISPVRTTTDYPLAVRNAADQALAAIAKDLQARPRAKDQAIGLYAQLVSDMGRAAEDDERNYPDCSDERCIERRWRAARAAALPYAQAAARLAVASQDPHAYAMGLLACRLNWGEGVCRQLSTPGWARSDPDNAIPWLYQADEALARNDSAAITEALTRAARAKKSDLVWPSILMLAEHPIARGLAPAPRLVLLTHVFGVYAAFPIPPYRAVADRCKPESMKETQNRQLCSDLATLMTEHSSSVIEFNFGIKVGENSGWPPERVQRLRDVVDAIRFVEQTVVDVNDIQSCRFLEHSSSERVSC
jgi:hypothetical protein